MTDRLLIQFGSGGLDPLSWSGLRKEVHMTYEVDDKAA